MAKPKTTNVTMRVKVGDSELEVTGPSDFVEQRIAEFLKPKEHPSIGPNGGSTSRHPATAASVTKQMSAAQFFKKVNPTSDVNRALAAGYYMEKFIATDRFTTSEIAQIIRGAKIAPPANPSDVVAKNIAKGYMMAAGDKDGSRAYVLTTDGEQEIETMLNA